MRALILNEKNFVINAVVSSPEFAESQGWLVSENGNIGDTYNPETGNFATPMAPVAVPDSVPALAALLSLDAAGYAEAYEAWSDDPARTFTERAFINKAQRWGRHDETLLTAASDLGISDNEVDQLFINAAEMNKE